MVGWGESQPALAADQAQMMTTCNSYAAQHLHVSPSDIVDLEYEGQRTDGTHAVNGSAADDPLGLDHKKAKLSIIGRATAPPRWTITPAHAYRR